MNAFKETPIEIPIDGILDLHTFKPSEVKDLIFDYLKVCNQRGILNIRIIHGKGMGILQRTVHSVLRKIPEVSAFHLAGQFEGGLGATIVSLKPLREAHK